MSSEPEDEKGASNTISGSGIVPRNRVEHVIRANRGKENVIPSCEIAAEAGINEEGNYTETKEIIRDLLDKEQVPIGATHQGYYLMETNEEVEDYLSTLRSRVHEINRRIEMVEDAAEDAGIREDDT